MRAAARRRVPEFALDYLEGGIGRGQNLAQNREVLDRLRFNPRYITDGANEPDCTRNIFGHTYDAPFGVAPIGLGGLIWPRAAEYLAAAATSHNLPFILSGFATTTLETIANISRQSAWYQQYVCFDEDIDRDMLARAKASGYRVLVITVDIPTANRRDHDLRNGVSVPPRFDWRTLRSAAACPAWCLATLRAGLPQFQNLLPYVPRGAGLDETAVFLTQLIEGHVTPEKLAWIRENWNGVLLVKGILNPADARTCIDAGADGLVVSNHGGRQLDGCLSAAEALPAIREVVGEDIPLLADGGVRNGLDIARMIAAGADLVLLGRPFMYAVAAMGERGAAHVMDVLKTEFVIAMRQIGCRQVADLPHFLAD